MGKSGSELFSTREVVKKIGGIVFKEVGGSGDLRNVKKNKAGSVDKSGSEK